MYLTSAISNTSNFLKKILLIGTLFTLVGLLLVPDNSKYHTIYYILVLAPTVLLSIINSKTIIDNISNITKIFILFAIWSSLTVLWNDTDASILAPIKRSIYIISLFISFSVVNSNNDKIILKVFISAGILITAISVYSLYFFIIEYQPGMRFTGTGSLHNPLLSSHVFGLFSVLFITLFFTALDIKTKTIYLAIGLTLLTITFATGSRTPLIALSATAIWIAFIFKNKNSIIIIALSIMIFICIYLLHPELITSRGVSYRPELWSAGIEKILSRPFLGYGFDSPTAFHVSSLDMDFKEPHNIHLSILYFTGAVGFILWCTMHTYALWVCWKNRANTLFVIGSALLIYGIMAGMTEGGGLLSRPKEHWFITWIPLAFISSFLTNKTDRKPLEIL